MEQKDRKFCLKSLLWAVSAATYFKFLLCCDLISKLAAFLRAIVHQLHARKDCDIYNLHVLEVLQGSRMTSSFTKFCRIQIKYSPILSFVKSPSTQYQVIPFEQITLLKRNSILLIQCLQCCFVFIPNIIKHFKSNRRRGIERETNWNRTGRESNVNRTPIERKSIVRFQKNTFNFI